MGVGLEVTDFGRRPAPRAILGDATPGRVLRVFSLYIRDGTNNDTIKVSTSNVFNGDEIAAEDNLGELGDTDNFNLSYGGETLTIKASALTGNAVVVISPTFRSLSTGVVYTALASALLGAITLAVHNATTGAVIDLRAAVDLGYLDLLITYLTDA